jgi:hypothetical protein
MFASPTTYFISKRNSLREWELGTYVNDRVKAIPTSLIRKSIGELSALSLDRHVKKKLDKNPDYLNVRVEITSWY